MGFTDWLKSILGISRKRDVSRLQPVASSDASGATTDPVEETIDLSGKPLKEKHRRRGWRDKRLVPKTKGPRIPFTKRKKVMPLDEATRLFAGTLRTRNRNLRDLLADEEQLRRFNLPIWKTEQDVAAALGINVRQLRYFSVHREKECQPHYITFAIPKRSGGKRLIMAPKRRLKAIQRALLVQLVEKLPVSEHAHGFRKGRNVRSGAEAHVDRDFLLKIDLKDFFPSVTFARVRGLLISYGYGYTVATVLAVLMTEAERQPVSVDAQVFHVPVGHRYCIQGAPTSPTLCNAIVLRLDRRLAGAARKANLNYTRYADDLTFSGSAELTAIHKFRVAVTRIIEAEGFAVNTAKTRIMRRGSRQQVTGVTVNKILGLSRKERRRIRAALHQAAKAHTSPGSRVAGQVAYLAMLNPAQASKLTGTNRA